MAGTPFTHLHLHTEYSLLDGFNPISELAAHCKETGVKAVAMTDHGNLYGYYRFYKEMTAAGIKPIIGCEIYLNPILGLDRSSFADPDDDLDGGRSGRPSLNHMTVLVRNEEGFKSLSRMISRAHVHDFHYKPVVTDENLRENAGGLICLSGCMTGRLSRAILQGRSDIALDQAAYFRDLFGKDNFFIEIHNHGMPEQIMLGSELTAIARNLGVPLVAANDVHYLHKSDAATQDALVALNMGKSINDPNRLSFMGQQEYYFKNREEMAVMFSGIEEALDGPDVVQELCDFQLDLGTTHFPSMPGHTRPQAEAALRKMAVAALGTIIPDNPESRARLETELAVIEKSGFADYFLIVSEMRNFAIAKNIPVGPARGSVAGSLLANAIGITDVDPLKHNLIFERFLNPDRVSPPDIDMDFCSERRDEVIAHIRDTYGNDRVSQVVTFGTYAPKSAIKDACRGYDIPLGEAERLAKMVDVFSGDKATYFAENTDLQSEKAKGGPTAQAISLAERLVGLPSQVGVHAAAIVITPGPTPDFVPLGRSKAGFPVTMADMDGVTNLGLLKLDILGLKTCTLVSRAVDMVRKNGIDLNIASIADDDLETAKIYSEGNSSHVFQIEDPSIQQFSKNLPVRSVQDFVMATSICRPGPMKFIGEILDRVHGKTPILPLHPKAPNVGADTYGILIYQEQVMEATRQLAGFSMGESDLVRRAMGKKDSDKFDKVRKDFVAGCEKNGIPSHEADAVFSVLADFAGYGFNKSHAVAYAMLSWQTAYLKAHHPTEFFAAALSCENKPEKLGTLLRDASSNGVRCSPPDVNKSLAGFSGSNGMIFFGLSGISGIRAASVDAIVAHRPYSDFLDFCAKTLPQGVNAKDLRVLAEAGALDTFGERGAILSYISTTPRAKLIAAAQKQHPPTLDSEDLFGEVSQSEPKPTFVFPKPPSLSDTEKFLMEKQVLGFPFSKNPISKFLGLRHVFKAAPICKLVPGTDIKIIALLESKEVKVAKKNGNKRGCGFFSDETGQLPFVAWSTKSPLLPGQEVSAVFSSLISGNVYIIEGKLDHGGQLSISKATPIDDPIPSSRFSVLIDKSLITDTTINQIYDITRGEPGLPFSLALFDMQDGKRAWESVQPAPNECNIGCNCECFRDIISITGVVDIAARVGE